SSLIYHLHFNHTPTTVTYRLSLHDALPISTARKTHRLAFVLGAEASFGLRRQTGDFVERHALVGAAQPHAHEVGYFHLLFDLPVDRKSTRLNSSHLVISYAVFCLKKKTKR